MHPSLFLVWSRPTERKVERFQHEGDRKNEALALQTLAPWCTIAAHHSMDWCNGKSTEKSWKNLWKTSYLMEQSWNNHGKIYGKSWKNLWKISYLMETSWKISGFW